MAVYSDINGFPEAGFPVLSDVSDRVCLNTLYWNPLKEAGFILDVVGNNRLAGNLSLAGMLSGVTSITMNGALSGVSTITASGTATLTSSNPLSLTAVNANIRMPGLNSSIGSVLERVYKGYFKNLDVANTLTVNGDDVALIGDIKRYVSGTLNTLPKYNATGITDSKFTDDGTTPKYGANTIWHSGNDGAGSGLDADTIDSIQSSGLFKLSANYVNLDTYLTNNDLNRYGWTNVGLPSGVGFAGYLSFGAEDDKYGGQIAVRYDSPELWYRQISNGATVGWTKAWDNRNLNLPSIDFTAKDLTVTTAKIGSLSGYLKGTAGVVGAVSSIPESDISFTDITNGDASINKHGYFPKLPTPTGKYLRDDLTWQNVSGGTGTPGGLDKQVQWNDNGSFAGVARTYIREYYDTNDSIGFGGYNGIVFFNDEYGDGWNNGFSNGFRMSSGHDGSVRLGYVGSGDSGYMAPSDFRFSSGILGWNGDVSPSTWAIKYTVSGLGFFNTAPTAKPIITGSKGGNAALASLLTQLSNLGLITDSTT